MNETVRRVFFCTTIGAMLLCVGEEYALSSKNIVSSENGPASIMGPLRVNHATARYFTDANGKAVYLTGSHTHFSFQDREDAFNFTQYLEFLKSHNHNFIRLWMWEDARNVPLPYASTRNDLAKNGGTAFDVTMLNQDYFDRLRSRVRAAGAYGIYVSIMLFQGWSVENKAPGRDVWSKHPFASANNANGIDGDLNGNGDGEETHTLRIPAVKAAQERYVKKVVDTVNDLSNVLYEITNEDHASPENTAWQYHMIDFIHSYEATKPTQHPVGMTAQLCGSNDTLMKSPADWISPVNEKGLYQDDPPQSTGGKVILSDTDHLWGNGGSADWVWKSFTRGLNPIFMDLTPPLLRSYTLPQADEIRIAMGQTRAYARELNLEAMAPNSQACSTTYCLVNPEKEYVVYLPARRRHSIPVLGRFLRTVTVDLSPVAEPVIAEWFNPSTGETLSGGTTTGRVATRFTPPFSPAVLHLKVRGR